MGLSVFTFGQESVPLPPSNYVYPNNPTTLEHTYLDNSVPSYPNAAVIYPYNPTPPGHAYAHGEGHVEPVSADSLASTTSQLSLTSCDFTMSYIISREPDDVGVGEGALAFNEEVLTEGGCRSKFKNELDNFLSKCPEGVVAVKTNYSYGLNETESSQYGCYQNHNRATANNPSPEREVRVRSQRRHYNNRNRSGSGRAYRGNR